MAVVSRGRENLTARAYQVLLRKDLSHAIAPGEAIDDAALAQELGMSRTPSGRGCLPCSNAAWCGLCRGWVTSPARSRLPTC